MKSISERSTVTATLNFAADRTNGGIWSNLNRSLRTQTLQPYQVPIEDARHLSSPPTLEREGFQSGSLPIEAPQWTNAEWVDRVYVPRTLQLVRELSGARHAVSFYRGILIRDTGSTAHAPAADFVHLDQSPDSVLPFLTMAAGADILNSYKRFKVFNIWRPITPPPQDVPLAICDQRTVDKDDLVIGYTVEPSFPQRVAYMTSVFNPMQKWFYISDLTLDDVVVFKGYDNNADEPLGCLHGAFTQPERPWGATPRASVEFRAFAFFDA